jgi:hypothetical protein
MARTEGCWANVLDNCEGPLTEEHLISMAIWEPPPGAADNREAKKELSVRMVYGPEHPRAGEHVLALKDLTAPTLCRHHNNSSHSLDEAAKRFRHALVDTNAVRSTRTAGRKWPAHRVTVDGPLLERWFYKTVINIAAWQQQLPIGAADAQPARPSRDLATRVFDRGVAPRRPMGLGAIAQVGDKFSLREQYAFLFYDRNATHISGCLVILRGLLFVVKLEEHDTPEWVLQRVLGKPNAAVLQPIRCYNSDVDCELYLNWPNEPVERMGLRGRNRPPR